MTLKGDLAFIDLFHPIKIYMFVGDIEYIDLWPHIDRLFNNLDGTPVTMNDEKEFIEFKKDFDSDSRVKYVRDESHMSITLVGPHSMSNIGAYLPGALRRLNGRKIIATIEENRLHICGDPDHEVFGVYYTHNNLCAISPDDAKLVCKPNTLDTCIFLTLNPERGFMCNKFDSSSADMLNSFDEGELKASRIGDCKILGRNEPPKEKLDLTKYSDLMALVENKNNYIGWTLIDSGDIIDRGLGLVNKPLTNKVIDVEFSLNKDKTSAFFSIVGNKFTCGFDVEHGGIRKQINENELEFYGYAGHSFLIHK